MRSLVLGSFSLALAGLLSAACGDDSVNGGAGGGGGAPPAGGHGGISSGGGGGAPGDCVEITDLGGFNSDGSALYGEPSPALGGPDRDELAVYVPQGSAGPHTLASLANLTECDAEVCLRVVEDFNADGSTIIYVATGGVVELGAGIVDVYYVTGSLTDITLVEATIADDFSVTPVANGKCLTIPSVAFDIQPPAPGWICPPGYHDEGGQGIEPYCDCACGAFDPDCAIPGVAIENCADGQTCGASGECEGVPTDWMCAADQYDGGAGNGCDCLCGTGDPDCELAAEPVEGCVAGESCTGSGACYPSAWTCEPDYYGDIAGCDCAEAPGCGAQDPDCADPEQTLIGCVEATDVCVAGLCTAP